MEVLRRVRPLWLFIAADGPRAGYSGEVDACNRARRAAMAVDWPCDVHTRFSDVNQGCDPAVAAAIGWFFDHVDRGIILEDDCVPHPHFFPFCEELLERYSDDSRMMQISGFSPYRDRAYPFDYHFSTAFRCHGWATWKRAFQWFPPDLTGCDDKQILAMLREYSINRVHWRVMVAKYRAYVRGEHPFWDFHWNLSCYVRRGLCIVPEKNLVRNIGFDSEATHTRTVETVFSSCPVHGLSFPLRHPVQVRVDKKPEKDLDRQHTRSLPFKSRLSAMIRRILPIPSGLSVRKKGVSG